MIMMHKESVSCLVILGCLYPFCYDMLDAIPMRIVVSLSLTCRPFEKSQNVRRKFENLARAQKVRGEWERQELFFRINMWNESVLVVS